jgi:hypothetical protein
MRYEYNTIKIKGEIIISCPANRSFLLNNKITFLAGAEEENFILVLAGIYYKHE